MKTHAGPAVDRVFTDFGVDSSSRFPFRALTDRQTDRQTNSKTQLNALTTSRLPSTVCVITYLGSVMDICR